MNPGLRKLQKALAEDITTRVHSADDLTRAISASEILFGNSTAEALQSLSEQDILDIFEGVPTFTVAKDQVVGGIDVLTLLSESAKVFPSKGEARRSLQENAVSINKAKVTLETKITTDDLLKGKYIIAQKGRKNYYLLIAE